MTGFLSHFCGVFVLSITDLAARFWIGAVKSLAHVPLGARKVLARVVAAVFWVGIPKRRHVAMTNLRVCFPDKTEGELRAIAKANYVHLARATLDHGVLWNGSAQAVGKLVTFEGLERVTDKTNRPLIIVAPHFVGLDAVGIAFNLHVRGVSLYQKQRNAAWDEAALAGRRRFSDPVLIAKGEHRRGDLLAVVRAMRQGLPFYYLPDMDFGARDAVFVPFFGEPAATLAMCGRLAHATKAKVLFCVAEMTETGYTAHISEPWENYPTGDDVTDTRRINAELERWILKLPDQYLWTHRRFKTRPEGAKPLY